MSVLLVSLMLMPTPAEMTLLACAVETEATAGLGPVQKEAGLWVVHVALNRAAAGWWGTLEETLRRDFHAIDRCDVPDPWAREVVEMALDQEDPTGGAYFVLSTQDIARLGYIQPTHSFENGQVGLHFYNRWHWFRTVAPAPHLSHAELLAPQ